MEARDYMFLLRIGHMRPNERLLALGGGLEAVDECAGAG